MKKHKEREGKRDRGVIPLKDLVPREDPKAGKGRGGPAVFGVVPSDHRRGATAFEEEKGRKRD